MKGQIIVLILIVILAISLVIIFCGCKSKPKYKLDLCGEDFFYEGVKDSYKEGEKVEINYKFIATDTDYTFYVDGVRFNPDYSDEKGFIFRFIMPDHDVKIICESRNTMLYVPDEKPED